MTRALLALAAAAILATAGAAVSQQPQRSAGYLTQALDGAALVGPPPSEAITTAERGVYDATRALKDTPRWAQAVTDADLSGPTLSHGFGCAAGVALSPEATPATARLLARVGADIGRTVTPPKDHYQRPRPAVGNDKPICVAREPALLNNGSYPSGHAMLGWAYALLLAELVPERSDAILLRGREFGDSRVICGVHYPSDVEAGRTLAAALVARLHAEPQFTADMAAARAELAKAAPAQCPIRQAA
jgi:acid phosphatase (class A)